MTSKTCMTCFHHIGIVDNDTDCICTKDGGLGRYIDYANTFSCCDYENKEGHVYTLEEVSRELLEFCSGLIDDMIFYSATQQIPSADFCSSLCKWYRELADRLKELGVEL